MRKVTLRFSYTDFTGEKCVYVCQLGIEGRWTIGELSQGIRNRLEREVGTVSDFELQAQNDPMDILMMEDQSDT